MQKDLETELAQIAAEIPGIRDDIEIASEEDALPEDVDHVERRVSSIVERYSVLIRKVPADERGGVQRDLGMKIEILKAHVLKLRDDA